MKLHITPLMNARLTGLFWLLTILTGSLALFLKGRLGMTANLAANFSYLGATLLVFKLLNPVNKNIALLAAFFGITGCAIGLGHMFLKILDPIDNLDFVFFGLQCLLLGYLIFKSIYISRWVGILLSFGGLGWLVFGLTSVFTPAIYHSLSPYIMFPGIIGETSLTFWLLIKGIKKKY